MRVFCRAKLPETLMCIYCTRPVMFLSSVFERFAPMLELESFILQFILRGLKQGF